MLSQWLERVKQVAKPHDALDNSKAKGLTIVRLGCIQCGRPHVDMVECCAAKVRHLGASTYVQCSNTLDLPFKCAAIPIEELHSGLTNGQLHLTELVISPRLLSEPQNPPFKA